MTEHKSGKLGVFSAALVTAAATFSAGGAQAEAPSSPRLGNGVESKQANPFAFLSGRRQSRQAMEQFCPSDLAQPFALGQGQFEVANTRDEDDVMARIVGCHNQLVRNVSSGSVRRSYYGAASATGAFGAAIGGAAAAASTTQAWTLAGLLPVIVEDVIFSDESGTLDLVTARALRWTVNRTQFYDSQLSRMSNAERSIQAQIVDLKAAMAALQADPGIKPEEGKKTSEQEWQQRFQEVLKDAENINEAGKVQAQIAAIAKAMADEAQTTQQSATQEQAFQGVEDLVSDAQSLINAGEQVRRDLNAEREHGESRLSGWASGRYYHAMDVYRMQRVRAQKTPEQTFRSVLAFPFTTVSNLVRGGSDTLRDKQLATAATISPELSGMSEAIGLRANNRMVARVTPLEANLRALRTPAAQAKANAVIVIANELANQLDRGIAIMGNAASFDTEPAPNFALAGSGEAAGLKAAEAATRNEEEEKAADQASNPAPTDAETVTQPAPVEAPETPQE